MSHGIHVYYALPGVRELAPRIDYAYTIKTIPISVIIVRRAAYRDDSTTIFI